MLFELRLHSNSHSNFFENLQKQPPRGVLKKRHSENMQQIYRRTSMPKWDFNKVALQLYWNRTLTWVFSCKFVAYFQNTFSKEHLWVAASEPKTLLHSIIEYWLGFFVLLIHFLITLLIMSDQAVAYLKNLMMLMI